MTKVELIKAINTSKARSAWARGVKEYAKYLVEEIYSNDMDVVKADASIYLSGAKNWHEYSYGGCSLVYSYDIATLLCTPSELRKTDFGRKLPNSFENWLDVQARALFQAHRLITKLIGEC